MALETATYISDLVSTNPTASDNISQGDDHIRLLKATVKSTFPNITGAVTPTHTELNYVGGVTSAIQTQFDAKASLTGSETLTNKTLTTPVLSGTASGTTAGRLGYLSGALSYGTGSVQRTIVNTDEAQTLTNKTLSTGTAISSGTINGATIGATTASTGAFTTLSASSTVSGTGFSTYLASPPAIGSTTANTGKFSTLETVGNFLANGAAGTSGQVLTSGGSGAAPSWTTISAGGMTLLGTITTTSGVSQTLSGLDLTSYKQVFLVFSGVSAGSTNNILVGNSTADDVQVTGTTATGTDGFYGHLCIDLNAGIFNASLAPGQTNNSNFRNTATVTNGDLPITTASTAISVAASSGSFDDGSIRVYGVK